MKASPATVWRVPVYLPYLQPLLTEKSLAEAEHQIGFRLPDSYVALLREQNGGYICYKLPGSVHSQIYGIGSYFPSLTGFNWAHCRDQVSFQLDGLIPFDGDGHWHLCLDYRRNAKCPAVSHIDIECNNESEIAPSFYDYLSHLRLDIDEQEFAILDIVDLPRTLKGIATGLGVQFEPPDTYAHGYPVHRARGGTATTPDWIWISPNMVPRGFVREDNPRYEELRNLLTGDAPRYPDLLEATYLLKVTVRMQHQVLDACRELSIAIRPLIECVK